MSGKKHHYDFVVNESGLTNRPVKGSYGNNREIWIHLTGKGFRIELDTTSAKEASSVFAGEDLLFSDMIRKALLLFTIRYGRHLEIKKADFYADGILNGTYRIQETGKPFIYCLHHGKLKKPFGEVWRDSTITNLIATTSKSSYGFLFAALHALLAAKSDHYETERFTYYWMAMNALYSWFYEEHEPASGNNRGNERIKQSALLKHYGYEKAGFDMPGMNKKERDRREARILDKTRAVLKRIPENEIEIFCSACINNSLENEYVKNILTGMIDQEKEYDLPIFPMMLFWVPYKIRCASFHAETAIPTYCFEKDRDLQVLRVLNTLLDTFLTEQIAIFLKDALTKEEAKEV